MKNKFLNKILANFKAGVIWGLIMFIGLMIVTPLVRGEVIETKDIIFGFIWWVLLAGTLFGFFMNISRSKKANDKS